MGIILATAASSSLVICGLTFIAPDGNELFRKEIGPEDGKSFGIIKVSSADTNGPPTTENNAIMDNTNHRKPLPEAIQEIATRSSYTFNLMLNLLIGYGIQLLNQSLNS